MAMELQGKRILAFVDDEFEDLEMWYPVLRLREAGAEVIVAGPKEAGASYKGKYGVPIQSDSTVKVVDRHIVSGRRPPDLPAFLREFIRVLAERQ